MFIFIWLCSTASAISLEKGAEGVGKDKRLVTRVDQISPENSAALREWAESICNGRTVKEVADPLGIPATMASVIDFLAKDLPPSSREVVRDVCEQQLEF